MLLKHNTTSKYNNKREKLFSTRKILKKLLSFSRFEYQVRHVQIFKRLSRDPGIFAHVFKKLEIGKGP